MTGRCAFLIFLVWAYSSGPASAFNLPASDPWYSCPRYTWRGGTPDKFEHFWGSYVLAQAVSPADAFYLGVVMEVYNDKCLHIGFSLKDLLANSLGILSAVRNSQKSTIVTWLDWRTDQESLLFTVTVRF